MSLLYIEFSNNHIHLNQEDLDRLGIKELTYEKPLIAKGEYLAKERVTITSSYLKNGPLENVAILGSDPARNFSVAELNPLLFSKSMNLPYLHSKDITKYNLPQVTVVYKKNYINVPIYRQRPHVHTDPSANLTETAYDISFEHIFVSNIKNKITKLESRLLEKNVIGTIHLDPCDYFAFNPNKSRVISTYLLRYTS